MIHHGIFGPFRIGFSGALDTAFTLLPQYLQRLGMSTHMIGKVSSASIVSPLLSFSLSFSGSGAVPVAMSLSECACSTCFFLCVSLCLVLARCFFSRCVPDRSGTWVTANAHNSRGRAVLTRT